MLYDSFIIDIVHNMFCEGVRECHVTTKKFYCSGSVCHGLDYLTSRGILFFFTTIVKVLHGRVKKNIFS